MRQDKKRRSSRQGWIAMLLSLLMGGFAGVLLLNFIHSLGDSLSLGQRLLLFALTLFSFYAATRSGFLFP